MGKFRLAFSTFILVVLLVTYSLKVEARPPKPCKRSGKIKGRKPPPNNCNTQNHSECRIEDMLYTTFNCSPQVATHAKAFLTLNSFEKGGDGGGPSECDKKCHSDDIPIACFHNSTIKGIGRSVVAMVVSDCDSTMGCDEPHDLNLHMITTLLMPQKLSGKHLVCLKMIGVV
ncbi:hypothetical protein P3X46_014746 [Hevea brasiliensis]|uniref:Uncharacterized protein n=1 Tax=Hevea brasiliensis TaxID=3981 RepID=A0ABQ9LV02_HEVBR|nr:hypothetical protein P3X46_014746 [Hevea brasiliensis]